MEIKGMDEIDKKRRERNRDRMKKEISEDISEVVEDSFNRLEDFFKRKRIEKDEIERKRNWWGILFRKILNLAWISGLIILVLNFILVNIWLLRYFITSLWS